MDKLQSRFSKNQPLYQEIKAANHVLAFDLWSRSVPLTCQWCAALAKMRTYFH